MCKAMEEYANEKVAEVQKNTIIEMIKEGLGIDLIARVTRVTIEQVTTIGKQVALL